MSFLLIGGTARGEATRSNLTYRAPELCLGDPASYPGDLWAYGCLLEELAHRRSSFQGQSDADVVHNILKRLGTPMPPHAFTSRWQAHVQNVPSPEGVRYLTYYEPDAILQAEFDAVPLFVAAVSAPCNFRALKRGLLQLAPDERMTGDAAMRHPFFEDKLTPVVSEVAAGLHVSSFLQGELEPQVLLWLQSDPYWKDITDKMNLLRDHPPPRKKRRRGIDTWVERPPRMYEEGGYMGCEPPSVSKCGLIDCSRPCGARRVAAFARAFKRKSDTWLRELGKACRNALDERAGDIPFLARFFKDCLSNMAFEYGLLQIYKASEYSDNAHFNGDASFMLCGLTVWGKRSLDSFTTIDSDDAVGADTAASSTRGVGAWQSTPQEPGSFHIANCTACKTNLVYHTVENPTSECLHITVTLRTDLFERGRIGKLHEPYVYEQRLKDRVNEAVARFLIEQQPRMPNLTEVVHAHALYARIARLAAAAAHGRD
jgi:hypothetical protein